MRAEFVSVDVEGAVATIRLDRPPANALGEAVSREIVTATEVVAADDAVRAVVVWGGERLFAAGADIKAMVDWGPEEVAPDVLALVEACAALEAVPKPVTAAITGYALGGGLELALACDFRVASDNAKLGLPEIRLGIIPGAGGTQRLPRLVGLAKARDLILSGRHLDAAEAFEIGLVDRVVRAGEAYAAALEDARRWATGPTRAYGAAKRALLAAGDGDLAEGLRVEHEVFVDLFTTRDREEGMRAFLEKRDATFEGR
jgi:enoyl-CoA hydratase/carnithine racemase